MDSRDETFTKAEHNLLEQIRREGEAWIVPAQHRMARRLLRRGVISAIPKVTRYNAVRGSTERRVTGPRDEGTA